MFLDLSKFKLKDEFDRIIVFFAMQSFLFLLAKFYEYIKYEFTIISLVGFIIWLIFFRLYYKMINKLYYTFWSLWAVNVVFNCEGMISSSQIYGDISLFYLYLFSLGCSGIVAYLLFNPVFYPIVSWWEYDFRYRNDIKTDVFLKDTKSEGRLIDIRRGAGGLSLFKELVVGDIVTLKPNYNEMDLELRAEVVSKRQLIVGRPHTYGLKFHFESDEAERNFSKFQRYWQFERKHKMNVKYKALK